MAADVEYLTGTIPPCSTSSARSSANPATTDADSLLSALEEHAGEPPPGARQYASTSATLLAGTDRVDALLVCQWGGWEDPETFLDHYHGAHSPEVQRRARESVE